MASGKQVGGIIIIVITVMVYIAANILHKRETKSYSVTLLLGGLFFGGIIIASVISWMDKDDDTES